MTQYKFSVVTTFNSDGYNRYGRRMIETFLQQWPHEIELRVYAEQCRVTQTSTNLKTFDLETASPELAAFKQKWGNVPKANGDVSSDPIRSRRKDAGKGFKWNAVRFAHKVYAVAHAAKNTTADWLIWMDADMVCHSPMAISVLERFCPDSKDICFLGRRGKYTECGLYAMNLRSQTTRDFLAQFQQYYDNAEQGIFTLNEWHDSFVFDTVRKQHSLKELDWSGNLIKGEGHPLINCEWGAYLDHLKGNRKDAGRSKANDLLTARTEDYWRM